MDQSNAMNCVYRKSPAVACFAVDRTVFARSAKTQAISNATPQNHFLFAPGPCVCEGSDVACEYTGIRTVKVVPSPSVLFTLIVPSCSSTIFFATANPSPVPRFPLVEWNSSNICFIMLGGMPAPLSTTSITNSLVDFQIFPDNTNQTRFGFDRIQRVAQQIQQHLMHAIGIQRHRRYIPVAIADGHHAFFVCAGSDEFQAFFDQLPRLHIFNAAVRAAGCTPEGSSSD